MFERTSVTNNYSTEFDGKSILAIVALRPKMSYAEVLTIIKAEGGYVDENGIVRKGTARDKDWVVNG